jgi:hypothetical protein
MTKRRILRTGVLLGLAVAVALFFPAVRWRLWGLWCGEASYQGLPTSYWAAEVVAYVENGPRGFEVPATPLDSAKRLSGIGRPNYRYESLDPVHEGDAAAVPVLIALLRDGRPLVRRYAVSKLGAIGPPARAAVPALCDLLRDDAADRDAEGFNWSVRATAAWALGAIDPAAAAQVRGPHD